MAADNLGKNKGRVKGLIDQFNKQNNKQTEPAVVDIKPQPEKVSSSPEENIEPKDSSNIEQQVAPKGNKIRLGLKIANGIAAFVAFALAIGSVSTKLVRGDITGLLNVVKSTALIMFRASNVVMPITSFKDNFIKKLESNKVGKALSNTVGVVWSTLTSKPVKRFYTIAMAVLTIASAPSPLGIASAVVSLSAISYNVIKERLDVRAANRLKQEHNLLKQNAEHRQKQRTLIKALESSKLPGLEGFTQEYKASLGPKRDAQEVRTAVKTSKVAEVLRAVRDNTLEALAAIGRSITGDPIDQAMAAFVTLGNVTGEANKNLQNRKEKFALQGANDALQMEIAPYKNLEELKTLDRHERVKTEALSRFVTEVQNSGLSSKTPEERFAIICKEVERESAFAAPAQDSLLTRIASAITPGSRQSEKSPSGNVSNSHKSKETTGDIKLRTQAAPGPKNVATRSRLKPSATPLSAQRNELKSEIRGRVK